MDENMKIELKPQFDFDSECEKVELEILKPTDEVDARLDEIEGKIADLDITIDKLTNHADKFDYTVAVASGILTGLVDAIFVGTLDWNIDFDINSQRNETHKDFNKIIEDVAAKCGYTGEQRLKGSIGKLEDTFSVAQDNVWKGLGIGEKVEIPAEWASIEVKAAAATVDMSRPEFVRNVVDPINALKGDDLPVSAFNGREDGTWDNGTAAWE